MALRFDGASRLLSCRPHLSLGFGCRLGLELCGRSRVLRVFGCSGGLGLGFRRRDRLLRRRLLRLARRVALLVERALGA